MTQIGEDLKLNEDNKGEVHIEGITEIILSRYEEFMLLLSKGESHRAKRSTALNEFSSRSHTFVELRLCKGENSSRLTLVDLAGSEQFTDDQLRNKTHQIESKYINQSLTHLGRYSYS